MFFFLRFKFICVCGVCAETRGGCPISCTIILCFTHLRKELLLNLELNWWPPNPMVPQPWGAGACRQAQLFTWALGVWTLILRLAQQGLLPGESLPDCQLNFFFSSPLSSPLPSPPLPLPFPPLPSFSVPLPPSLCAHVCVCTWELIFFLYHVGLKDRTWVSRWWHLYALNYLICPGFTFKDMCAFYTLPRRSRSSTLLPFVVGTHMDSLNEPSPMRW